MKEALRRRAYLDEIAIARHIQPVERAHGAVRLAMDRAEGGEIMPADEHLGGFMHALMVEVLRHPPCPLVLQRQPGLAANDAVEIVPTKGGKAGVEILGHGSGIENGHGFARHGEMRIERVAKLVGLPVAQKIDMDNLPNGMHTGIGAAGCREWRRSLPSASEPQPPAHPEPRGRYPVSASHNRACRHIRRSCGNAASAEPRCGRNGGAAHEISRRHRFAARPFASG